MAENNLLTEVQKPGPSPYCDNGKNREISGPHVGVGQFSSGEVVSTLIYFGFHQTHVVQFDWSLIGHPV